MNHPENSTCNHQTSASLDDQNSGFNTLDVLVELRKQHQAKDLNVITNLQNLKLSDNSFTTLRTNPIDLASPNKYFWRNTSVRTMA